MIIRALDSTGDWTFGRGKSNYLQANAAIAQLIKTRLSTFLGECFFDSTAGVDWFNLNGNQSSIALNLAISSTILNTPGVTGILTLGSNTSGRVFTVSYNVSTIYSTITDTFQYDVAA